MVSLHTYVTEKFGNDPIGRIMLENAQRKSDKMMEEQKGDEPTLTFQEDSQPTIDALQSEQQRVNIKTFINQAVQDYEQGITNTDIFIRNIMCYFSNYIRLLSVEEIKNLLSTSLNVESVINEKGE